LTEEVEKQAQARVGCVLDDKWTLERLLGVGGMAAVYAGRHRNGARAAVKVLHPDLSRHKEVRERFLREGYAANQVEHVGAVKVLDDDVVVAGPESGTAYLVMELLEGESLQDRLERPPPMSELEFLGIAGSVLEVLEAAHARGVVHRDLKPENLFLVSDETAQAAGSRVKVLDFGLARLLQGQAITSYGLALGTPSFMSPEQAGGRIDQIDGRTDLFALAATGFRICTGRRIHEAPNAVELVRKMSTTAAPRVRSVRADVSEACARVIDRALEFRREDRYENAAAMREDVRRAYAELAGSGPTQLAVAVPPPAPALAPPPPRPTVSSSDQTTIEVGDSDLQEPSAQPLLSPGRRDPLASGLEESIHLPRQRSIWPWVALLLLTGAGAKMWFHHRATQREAEASASVAALPIPPPTVSAVAPSASGLAPVVVRDKDAGNDAASAAKAPASASALASGAPAKGQAPTTSSTHHAPAGKPGAPAVHKGTKKHHTTKPHPTPASTQGN
jgi:serine/threonine-protein kinase